MNEESKIKKLMLFGGIPTCVVSILGFIILSSRTVTVYADLPKKVEKIEDYIEAQQQANEIQKKANELLQKIVTDDRKDVEQVIISPDGKKVFNHKTGSWDLIKK